MNATVADKTAYGRRVLLKEVYAAPNPFGEALPPVLSFKPGHCDFRIDACDFDETIRIDYSQTPVVELDDSFLAQRAENTVHVNEGQAGGVADLLLGKRQHHFLAAMSWPLCTVTCEQFKEQMSDPFAR